MAWWKLEWIKLKKKRTQKLFQRRKFIISPEKPISIGPTGGDPAESRLLASQDVPCSPTLASLPQMFSSSGMQRSRHYCGVLKIAPSELKKRAPDMFGPADTSGRFSRLWPALWGATKVHVKSFELPPEPERNSTATTAAFLGHIASKELLLLSELRHPGMLCLMGLSYSNTFGLQLVFENIPFGSLYHALHIQKVSFSIEDICRMFIKLVEAVRFLHQHSWLHLGLSSHAVQLTAQNQGKLAGFQLAKQYSSNGLCHMSLEDVCLQETIINWQAPEQCLGEPVGVETDIYSLTVLLQEFITGKVPWEQSEAKHVRRSYSSGATLQNHGLLMSAETHALLQRGLVVQRSDRTLSLSLLEELCTKHLTSTVGGLDRKALDFAENMITKKKNQASKLFSFGAFKRHLSSCQSCAFNTSSPYPRRKSSALGKLIKRDTCQEDIVEGLEEIYFDDHFDAPAKLGTHLQLLPPECLSI